MLASFTALLISTGLGFLAGLGVGGGSLLLIWLTQVAHLPQDQAKILNLLFYLPAAMIAIHFHKKQKRTRPDITRPGILAGCSFAVCVSLLTKNREIESIKTMLGILLIFIGIKELLYRPRNAR